VRDDKLLILPVQFVNQIEPSTSQSSMNELALIYVDTSDDERTPPLQTGDQVVTSNLQYVRTGMAIKVVPPSELESAGS
jgi:hypothetical protein